MSEKQVRETWLQSAINLLTPIFKLKGYQMPKVHVSCGFPSTGNKSKHIGQCWPNNCCSANHGLG